MNDLEIEEKTNLADIENLKFERIVKAIGSETLIAISKSKTDTQVSMMQSLGLKGYLMIDSKNPVNLFSAAGGLFGNNITQQEFQEDN